MVAQECHVLGGAVFAEPALSSQEHAYRGGLARSSQRAGTNRIPPRVSIRRLRSCSKAPSPTSSSSSQALQRRALAPLHLGLDMAALLAPEDPDQRPDSSAGSSTTTPASAAAAAAAAATLGGTPTAAAAAAGGVPDPAIAAVLAAAKTIKFAATNPYLEARRRRPRPGANHTRLVVTELPSRTTASAMTAAAWPTLPGGTPHPSYTYSGQLTSRQVAHPAPHALKPAQHRQQQQPQQQPQALVLQHQQQKHQALVQQLLQANLAQLARPQAATCGSMAAAAAHLEPPSMPAAAAAVALGPPSMSAAAAVAGKALEAPPTAAVPVMEHGTIYTADALLAAQEQQQQLQQGTDNLFPATYGAAAAEGSLQGGYCRMTAAAAAVGGAGVASCGQMLLDHTWLLEPAPVRHPQGGDTMAQQALPSRTFAGSPGGGCHSILTSTAGAPPGAVLPQNLSLLDAALQDYMEEDEDSCFVGTDLSPLPVGGHPTTTAPGGCVPPPPPGPWGDGLPPGAHASLLAAAGGGGMEDGDSCFVEAEAAQQPLPWRAHASDSPSATTATFTPPASAAAAGAVSLGSAFQQLAPGLQPAAAGAAPCSSTLGGGLEGAGAHMGAPGHLDTIASGTLLFGTVSDELMLSWLAEGEPAVPPLCGDAVPLCGDTEGLAGLELGLVV